MGTMTAAAAAPHFLGHGRAMRCCSAGSEDRRTTLRSLNSETTSNHALKTRLASSRLVNVEVPVKSSSHSSRSGAPGRAASNSGAAARILELLNTSVSEEGVASALASFDGALSPFDLVAVLNGLSSRWSLALSLWTWVRAERASSLNIYTYNVMLKVLRRGRQWELAERVAMDMIHAGILPDNITYSTLISCANRCNHQDEAMAWFDRMHEAGCVPDAVTYSTMIDAYGKMGKYNEAVALYERLKRAGWKPDKVTYGTMMRLFGRAGYMRAALSTFQEMKESGVQPDSVVYNILISSLGRSGRMGHALRIFEEMEKAGVQPNAVTMSTVMETYNKSGKVVEGLQVFSRFKRGVTCDIIVYNKVIKMCGDAGFVSEAGEYFREMVEVGCSPNDWTYRIMIRLYGKQGMTIEAQGMFSALIAAGYGADVMAYTCLLQAYGNAREYVKVKEILEEMKCATDERLCCVVLNLLNFCDREEDVALVRSCLRMCNRTLDGIVGRILEEDIVVENEIRELLREISSEAHKPICNSLVQLAWHKGGRHHAFQLLPLLTFLNVYSGLQSKSPTMWALHLRSLSTGAAHCALLSWLSSVRCAIQEDQELPGRMIIETGVGRQTNAGELRVIVVISSVLKDMSSPFDECADRKDWLEASGVDVRQWLQTASLDLPKTCNI